MTSNPIIELRGFSFAFGAKAALADVTLSVQPGEYVSVIGPNGAGKTTLLKCLNRILRGGTGSITVAGRELGSYPQRELARVLSYVPQAEGRTAPYTVGELVAMGRYPYFRPFAALAAEDKKAVADALDLTGTAEFADRPLGSLSGGERQKVFIAAAVAQSAKVMLLDEPTTFLDPLRQVEIHSLLHKLHRERGATIISVTHDVAWAVLESETVVALQSGRVVYHGSAEDLTRDGVLENIYGTRFHRAANPDGGRPLVFPVRPS